MATREKQKSAVDALFGPSCSEPFLARRERRSTRLQPNVQGASAYPGQEGTSPGHDPKPWTCIRPAQLLGRFEGIRNLVMTSKHFIQIQGQSLLRQSAVPGQLRRRTMRSETLWGAADATGAERHTVLVPCRSGGGDSSTSDHGTRSESYMPLYEFSRVGVRPAGRSARREVEELYLHDTLGLLLNCRCIGNKLGAADGFSR
jgi:hypothetical protein